MGPPVVVGETHSLKQCENQDLGSTEVVASQQRPAGTAGWLSPQARGWLVRLLIPRHDGHAELDCHGGARILYTMAQQLFGALRGRSVVGGCSPPDVARGQQGMAGFMDASSLLMFGGVLYLLD